VPARTASARRETGTKGLSVLLRVRCPPTAFLAAIRLERRRRHVPSRRAALKQTTRSNAHPKVLHIGAAQTISVKDSDSNVRVGSIATEMGCPRYVHFSPDSDRRMEIVGGLKRAKTGSDKPYSITSSVRARRVAGISIPSDFVVLRLMRSRNLTGEYEVRPVCRLSEFDRHSKLQVERWRESPARKKSVRPSRKASLQGDRQ
jgi:hypothetical protein